MSASLLISRSARADIVDCAGYLATRTELAAERLLDALEKDLNLLAANPELGTSLVSANPRLGGLRIWRVKGFERYLLFYRYGDGQVELIRVLHAARDWLNLLELP